MPGPKLAAGIPCSPKNATSVQPSFARTGVDMFERLGLLATASISDWSRGWLRLGGQAGAVSRTSILNSGVLLEPSLRANDFEPSSSADSAPDFAALPSAAAT